MNIQCDCGATVDGKWADIHSPTCPAVSEARKIEDIIKYNCSPVEGYPMSIDGIENAAAAILAHFKSGTISH